MDEIILKVKGKVFGGWTSVIVEKSLFTMAGAFGLAATDIFPGSIEKWDIVLGDACSVEINGQTLIMGHIEDMPIAYDSSSHNIQIGGRDRTGDLVDCSFVEDMSQWKGISVGNIVKNLCKPFNINVVIDNSAREAANTKPGDIFVAQEGMSVFETMAPMLKINGILPVSYGDGKLTLTRAGTTRTHDILELGVNIKSGGINQSFKDRFRTYIVKGQGKGNDNKSPGVYVSPNGIYTDDVISRYRPMIILPDNSVNGNGDCKNLAKWEAVRRAGESIGLSYEVQGWTQSNGDVWPFNSLVRVKDKFAGINGDLLIASTSESLDGRGKITRLSLVDPKTLELPESNEPIKTIKTKVSHRESRDFDEIEASLA